MFPENAADFVPETAPLSTPQTGSPHRLICHIAPPPDDLRHWPWMLFQPAKLLPLLLFPFASGFPQTFPPASRETFQYAVEWRLITAGRVRVEWSPAERSDPAWRVRMRLESIGLVSKLFKVEDEYRADLNAAGCVESASIDTHEGNRQRETRITFDGARRRANYLERDRVKEAVVLAKETEIPSCVHDVVGGLFFLRTLNLEPGQSTSIPVSDGKKSVMAKVEAQQHEQIKTPAGTFQTTRYEIYLFNDVLFHRPAHLYVWLTDDRRRLPVQIRVRMQITVGTITLQLENVQ